jgi:hypothetical protein
LLRLPEWKAGQERQLIMPYGLKVTGRLKGQLAGEWLLPASGNQIGDTWLVGEEYVPWVWLTVPGTAAPNWVDP